MKAKACLRKVHGLEQRVTVIIRTIGCLHLQLSCKWFFKKKKKAAVFGLCLSLVSQGLANEDFLLHFKSYLEQCNWKWGVDLSAGSWPLRLCPLSVPAAWLRGGTWQALVLQLQPAVLYSSTSKMFALIVFADVIAYSNKAELWPHKTSCVTNDFFFLWMLKFSKYKE